MSRIIQNITDINDIGTPSFGNVSIFAGPEGVIYTKQSTGATFAIGGNKGFGFNNLTFELELTDDSGTITASLADIASGYFNQALTFSQSNNVLSLVDSYSTLTASLSYYAGGFNTGLTFNTASNVLTITDGNSSISATLSSTGANSAFNFNPLSNILTITDGFGSKTASLSYLSGNTNLSYNSGLLTLVDGRGTLTANIGNANQTLIPKDVSVNVSHIGRLMVWDIGVGKAKVSFIEGGSPGVALDYRLRVTSAFTAPTSATWEIKFNNLPSDGHLFKLVNPITNTVIENYIAKTSPTLANEFAIGGSVSDSVDNLAVLLASSTNLQYDSKTSSSVFVTLNVLPFHLGTLGNGSVFETDGTGTYNPVLYANGEDKDWNQPAFSNNAPFIQTYKDGDSFININYDDIFNPATNGGIGSTVINGRNFPSTIEEERDMVYNVLYAQLDNYNVPSSRFLFTKNSTNDIDVTATTLPLSDQDYLSISIVNMSAVRNINGSAPIPDLVYKPILGVLKSIIGSDCIIENNIFYTDLIMSAGASSIDTSGMSLPQEINAETCLMPYDNGTVIPLKDIWDYNIGNPPSNLFYWILNYSPFMAMENSPTNVAERTIKTQINHQFYIGNS